MTYIGKPAISGSALTWSGNSLVFDTTIGGAINPLEKDRIWAYEGEDFVDASDLWFEKIGIQSTLTLNGDSASKISSWSNGRDAVNISNGKMQNSQASTSTPGQILTIAVAGTFTASTTNIGIFTAGSSPMIFGGYTDNSIVPGVTSLFIAPQGGTTFAPITATAFSNNKFVYVVRYKQSEYRHTIYVQSVGTFSVSSSNSTLPATSYSNLAIGGFFGSGGIWDRPIACLYAYRYKTDAEMDEIRDALQAQYAL